jgi:hypothetical protein
MLVEQNKNKKRKLTWGLESLLLLRLAAAVAAVSMC